MRPAYARPAIVAHRSGPIPAGSPAVSATSGAGSDTAEGDRAARSAFVVAVLDEGAVALLAQPVLVGLVGLACADRLAGGGLLALLRGRLGAALDHLREVPSERRLERLAHLAGLERVHDAL